MDIRFLTKEDVEAWAGLLSLAFDRPLTEMEGLWDWFHAGRELVVCGAWDGKQLVAQYSSLLAFLQVPGLSEPVEVGISTNMAVHPAYRGRGLIKQVASPVYAALMDRGCVAGVGFSNATGVKVDQRSRGYGYQVVGQMESKLVWLGQGSVAGGFDWAEHWIETGWDCLPNMDYVRFVVTPMGIYQRYGSHPFRVYRFGIWREQGRVVGVVVDRPVCRHNIQGSSLLAVYGQNLPALLERWVGAVRASGVRFAHFLMTSCFSCRQDNARVGFLFFTAF